MFFLLALMGCLGAYSLFCLRSLIIALRHRDGLPGVYLMLVLPEQMLLFGLICGIGFQPFASTGYNYMPWLLLIGAGGIIVSALEMRSRLSARIPPFQRISAHAWTAAALAHAYIAYAATDHLIFFAGDDTLIVNPEFTKDSDVTCNAAWLLVRIESDIAHYRCPLDRALIDSLGQPFVAWPAYEKGESRSLARSINRLRASAEKVRLK